MRRDIVIAVLCLCTVLLQWPACGEVTVVNNDIEAQRPVQLNGGNFDNEVRRVPSSHGMLIEFYAHW